MRRAVLALMLGSVTEAAETQGSVALSSLSTRTSQRNQREEQLRSQREKAKRDSKILPERAPGGAVEGSKCDSEGQCHGWCHEGRCTDGRPPAAPKQPSTLWKRGTELFLREREVQLREDLALGEGPVISGLAALRDVPPAVLGRLMRAHRAELIAAMGDGSEPAWASRVLIRLDAWTSSKAQALSPAGERETGT